MSLEFKTTITYELENVFGRKIVSLRDCMELSDDIFIKTRHRLNPNTLRRFFNLVKADYPPSKSTLTILAKYCGFQSINDIYKVKNTETFDAGILNPDTVLHFLVALFNDGTTIEKDDAHYLLMSKHVTKFLNTNKFLTDRFQSMIAKVENGRKYYYEQMVNVDKLNSFYGNGLRYYVLEKGTPDAEIFTASLYVLKYWLSGEEEKLIKAAEGLLKKEIDKKLPILTLARQLAAILFYNEQTNVDNEAILKDIRTVFNSLVAYKKDKSLICQFLLIISKALLLTGHAEEVLYYIENTKLILEHQSCGYFIQNNSSLYTLVEAYAQYNSGNIKEAVKLFDQIKSSEFPFLTRKFSCILYLSLLQKIRPKQNSKSEEQLISLISETGFKRLSDI